MYKWDSVVRFSEGDKEGKLGLLGILNYFQDCSEFQSVELGVGSEDLGKYAWVLNSWQIQVKSYPKTNDKITVATAPHAIHGIQGDRNFSIYDEKGEIMVQANSVWSFFDIRTQRPLKVPENMLDVYPLDPPLDMEYEARRINIRAIDKEAYTAVGSYTAKNSMLDVNRHLNNVWYVAIAEDYLPEELDFNQVRVEYQRPVQPESTVQLHYYKDDDRTIMLHTDEDFKVYAIVEFKKVEL